MLSSEPHVGQEHLTLLFTPSVPSAVTASCPRVQVFPLCHAGRQLPIREANVMADSTLQQALRPCGQTFPPAEDEPSEAVSTMGREPADLISGPGSAVDCVTLGRSHNLSEFDVLELDVCSFIRSFPQRFTACLLCVRHRTSADSQGPPLGELTLRGEAPLPLSPSLPAVQAGSILPSGRHAEFRMI